MNLICILPWTPCRLHPAHHRPVAQFPQHFFIGLQNWQSVWKSFLEESKTWSHFCPSALSFVTLPPTQSVWKAVRNMALIRQKHGSAAMALAIFPRNKAGEKNKRFNDLDPWHSLSLIHCDCGINKRHAHHCHKSTGAPRAATERCCLSERLTSGCQPHRQAGQEERERFHCGSKTYSVHSASSSWAACAQAQTAAETESGWAV